jgi:hypothetical protein
MAARSHSPAVVVEEPHDPRDADPDRLGEDEGRAAVGPPTEYTPDTTVGVEMNIQADTGPTLRRSKG